MTQNQQQKGTPTPPTRPIALSGLFRGIQTLPGIGAKVAETLGRLIKGQRMIDLLFHLPIDLIDRTYRPDLHHALAGKYATLSIEILEHKPSQRPHLPYRIIGTDGIGYIDLIFFHVRGTYLENQYPVGGTVTVGGILERFAGKWQMAHPDLIQNTDFENDTAFCPIYPLTAGVTNKMMVKYMDAALKALPDLPEWQDSALLTREKWPGAMTALKTLHTLPNGVADLSPNAPARLRLAYDELLADQVTIHFIRQQERLFNGRRFTIPAALRDQFLSHLPYQLTGAQIRALADIDQDMQKGERMMRLLQGDVGSGKTIIAALTLLTAAGNGVQGAIMAPTEILAQQHAKTLIPLFEAAGIKAVILTGRHKGQARAQILNQIEKGEAQIVIGTHALFQDGVVFHDLGCVVIDEQHRFGVHQRVTLTGKGTAPDVLVMTATPIPRTLALTLFGDLDVSVLDEKPPGRKPVDTRLIPSARYDDLAAKVANQSRHHVQVYWVCPLVEESEILDLSAAKERHQDLIQRFPDLRIGLVHGRMKPAEKDSVMTSFTEGQIDILVATTVIEVGVNVPNASIMVIEQAQRYGLAQLHQLRGRVGRGHAQSFCFLMYNPECSEIAKERLKIMRESEDGFYIAEKDLSLRGSGDILGTQQSGMMMGRFADLAHHANLLNMARDDARVLLDLDPDLTRERGKAIRHLLYFFEREQAIRRLPAG
jgi:ATP-dependent DNA helicase RecG